MHATEQYYLYSKYQDENSNNWALMLISDGFNVLMNTIFWIKLKNTLNDAFIRKHFFQIIRAIVLVIGVNLVC